MEVLKVTHDAPKYATNLTTQKPLVHTFAVSKPRVLLTLVIP